MKCAGRSCVIRTALEKPVKSGTSALSSEDRHVPLREPDLRWPQLEGGWGGGSGVRGERTVCRRRHLSGIGVDLVRREAGDLEQQAVQRSTDRFGVAPAGSWAGLVERRADWSWTTRCALAQGCATGTGARRPPTGRPYPTVAPPSVLPATTPTGTRTSTLPVDRNVRSPGLGCSPGTDQLAEFGTRRWHRGNGLPGDEEGAARPAIGQPLNKILSSLLRLSTGGARSFLGAAGLVVAV